MEQLALPAGMGRAPDYPVAEEAFRTPGNPTGSSLIKITDQKTTKLDITNNNNVILYKSPKH
jgi:hypothetical protein